MADGDVGTERPPPSDVRSALEGDVGRLKASGALADPAVERAFRRVPRHRFLERFFLGDEGRGWTPVEHDPARPRREQLATIYSEAALVTRLRDSVATSSSSQPALTAHMLHLLELRPGMRVLEVGVGTGYTAALLAELVGDPALVTTLDTQPEVVAQARRGLARAGCGGVAVRCRDGFAGAPEAVPFDRIVASVGCPDLSPRWAEQLAPEGCMLIPLRHAGANPLVRAWREGAEGRAGDLLGRVVGSSGFMAARGALADPASSAAYYAASPARMAEHPADEERPLWHDLRDRRLDFWFYLGVRDPRARLFRWLSSFGLADEAAGATARVEQDRLAGAPALLGELEALHEAWRAIGCPERGRYRLRFVPVDASVDAASRSRSAAGPWTLPGRYYHRQFALPPSQDA